MDELAEEIALCVSEIDECKRENVKCGGKGICVDGVNQVRVRLALG